MLPPTIPTSFVPRPSDATARRFTSDLSSAFGFFAYGILGGVFVLAIGVFFYSRILVNTQSAKNAELKEAEAKIELATVENFVRLRNRLEFGATLFANHSAFSSFFTLLETLIPSTVRFVSLHLALHDTTGVKLDGSGVAKSFNALAVASAAFATDGRIKDAVFSNIVVNSRDNSVSFALTATLDPKSIAFSPSAPTTVPLGSSDIPIREEISSTTPSL